MKKSTRQSAAIAFGAIGIVLTFIACGLAFIGGLVMLIAYYYVYGAGLITMLAGVVLFFTFIVGFIAVMARSAHAALASAIMSLICATAIICCMGVPFQSKGVCVLPIIAAIFAFAAFIMFTLNFINTPVRMKNISEKDFQRDKFDLQNQLQQELKMLNADFAENVITQEEYNERKQAIFNRRYDYLENAQTAASHKTATKKQTACAFAIPSAIMAVIFVIVIPIVHFGVCKYAYAGLLNQMSNMNDGMYCACHSSFRRFDELLPNDYKDVAAIRQQMRDYQYSDCVRALNATYAHSFEKCGDRARVAYARLMKWQSDDPRWGFKTLTELSETLISDASWQCGGEYFEYVLDEEVGEYVINTNLPYFIPEEEPWSINYYCLSSYENGEVYIEFQYVMHPYVGSYVDGYTFTISNFRYDADKSEFAIDVYCYQNDTTYTMTYTETHNWSDFEW